MIECTVGRIHEQDGCYFLWNLKCQSKMADIVLQGVKEADKKMQAKYGIETICSSFSVPTYVVPLISSSFLIDKASTLLLDKTLKWADQIGAWKVERDSMTAICSYTIFSWILGQLSLA
jgi:hypothetical protein